MVKPTEKFDNAVDRIDLENYGVGVPATAFLVSSAIFIWVVDGLLAYDTLSVYGQFGVVVALLICASLLFFAGYTFRMIDKYWWVENSDDAPGVEDAD